MCVPLDPVFRRVLVKEPVEPVLMPCVQVLVSTNQAEYSLRVDEKITKWSLEPEEMILGLSL